MRGLVVTPDDPSRVKQRLRGHCRALEQAIVPALGDGTIGVVHPL